MCYQLRMLSTVSGGEPSFVWKTTLHNHKLWSDFFSNGEDPRWKWTLLRHCPRFPWIWGRANRLGGTPKPDRCVLQRKVGLGKKKEGWVSIVNRVRSGFFFVFEMVKPYVLCIGARCSKRPREREPGPRISSDWPTRGAALSDRHEVSHQKISEYVGGFFYFQDGLPIP